MKLSHQLTPQREKGQRQLSRRDLLGYGFSFAAMSAFGGHSFSALAQVDQFSAPTQQRSKPNILFMLADNLGYGVPCCYNGGILDTPTPRIDKLAAEGLRLTNFNVENQCSPSRAALMTGRLPIRSGIGKAMAAGAPGGLHPWEITIPEMLSDAGYRTAMFGKWHLGSGRDACPLIRDSTSGLALRPPTLFTGTGSRNASEGCGLHPRS
jgi:hypothetical protein